MKNTQPIQNKNSSNKRIKIHTILLTTLVMISTFVISACSDNGPVPVTRVNITDEEKTILVGETTSLTAEIFPTTATNKLISWTSDDSSVATINRRGEIAAISVGEATMTATTIDGNFTDTCIINVVLDSIRVSGITLNQANMIAYLGDTPRLTPTIQPANAENKNVTWSSSNLNVATINDGLISTVSIGTTTITVTSLDGGFTDSCALTVEQPEPLNEMTIDKNARFSYGTYSTNFGKDDYNGIDYGFYRVSNDNQYSGMVKLLSSRDNYDYTVLAGSFYNDDPIRGIRKITISYISQGGLVVRYGETRIRAYSQTLAPINTSWTTTTISLSVTSGYFSLETNGEDAFIQSIKIGYNSLINPSTNSIENIDKRIAPTVYSGTLVDGVSSVSIPNDITITGNTYKVNSSRTYTYYSYNYVNANKRDLDLDSIAMTDPVDVSNYYIAFHAIPANFGHGNDVSEDCATITQVNNLFGDDARSVKQYSRNDGYATSVPWRAASGKSLPVYYEFDIAIDNSYTTSSRGTGRVVVWVNGWTCYTNNTPVSVYTDDHYTTFTEYLNYGSFGTRFDGEPENQGYRTGYENFLGSIQLDG